VQSRSRHAGERRLSAPLKQRIASRFGHLDNEGAAELLARIDTSRLVHIIAAHLSRENNTPALASVALATALNCATAWIGIANQFTGFRLARDVMESEGEGMQPRQELYKGKAKTVYATDDPHHLVMHYRDDVSAFDGVKLAQLPQKGETNNKINAFVMGKLSAAGIPTHFVRLLNERDRS
jgi:hypothetical protein